MTAPDPRVSSASAHPAADGRLGIPFQLLLVWLFFEFGRPPNPLGIPLLISLVLAVYWLKSKDKQWSRQSLLFTLLLASMAVGVMLATNTYSAFWQTREVAVLFLCICLPTQALITSVRKARLWLYTMVTVAMVVGLWAASHGGYGPAGRDGGQDENYVAALMCMAMPLAYFLYFSDRRIVRRVVLAGAMIVYVAAIALGQNPSRGGFVGLCAVGLYCLMRSPRKLVGIGVMTVVAAALLVVAGPTFWAEIGTTADISSGTSDVRLEIWKIGLRMWEANPIFGVGPANFRWEIENFQSAEQFVKFGRGLGGSIIAHSLWVEMLAEVGVVGVVLTFLLTFATWTGLAKVRDDVLNMTGQVPPALVQLSYYADAIRAAILAILVNGLFLSLYYYSHLWLLLAFGSALPFVYRRECGIQASRPPLTGAARAGRPRELTRSAATGASGIRVRAWRGA